MSPLVPFMYVNGTLTLVICGESYTITKDNPNFDAVREGLASQIPENELLELVKAEVPEVTLPNGITLGDVSISNNTIYYKDKVVHQSLIDEMLDMVKEELPIGGMMKFIDRLYGNMSNRASKELLSFIQRNSLTIDSEGYLIAYKAVREDYKDKYSGKISYEVGEVVEMDRRDVDDDFGNACGTGLHAGALDYVYGYGGGDDRIVIVKIDPADVVSVPQDSNCQKLRTCKFEVVGDFEGELKKKVYDVFFTTSMMYEEDWEEMEENDTFDWSQIEDVEDMRDSAELPPEQKWFEDDHNYLKKPINKDEEEINKPTFPINFGIKPNGGSQAGRRYYNERGDDGRFRKQ